MTAKLLCPRVAHLTRATINFSSSGDNTIISADPDNKIFIQRLWLVTGGTTSLTFKDNLSSPGAIPMIANGALVFDMSDEPWFITAINTPFIINSINAIQVSGIVHYSLAAV